MSLKFSPGNHSYWMSATPDDTRRIRVTGATTLKKKGLPIEGLKFWSARTVAEYVADNPERVDHLREMGRGPMVNALKGVPFEAADQAALRGTAIHALAEKIIHGETVDVSDEHMPLIEGYIAWLDAFDVKFEWTEKSLGNRSFWYAGRGDFRGSIEDQPCSADWKTGGRVYGGDGLQVAAYDNAEFYVNDDDPDTEIAIEPTGSLAVVHITPYETRHHWVKDPAAAWQWFKHVAYVGRNADEIDGCLGDPEPLPEEGAA